VARSSAQSRAGVAALRSVEEGALGGTSGSTIYDLRSTIYDLGIYDLRLEPLFRGAARVTANGLAGLFCHSARAEQARPLRPKCRNARGPLRGNDIRPPPRGPADPRWPHYRDGQS